MMCLILIPLAAYGFIMFYHVLSFYISSHFVTIKAVDYSCSDFSSTAEVPTTKTLQESVERVAKSPQGPKKLSATAGN